ncbi:MAG: hypothetical protein LBB98_12390 [Treponema sp.]|nr:hypothetical protein [Treponema sp.]
MKKIPFCLTFLLFPLLLWAADNTAALPLSFPGAELVRFLREEGYDVEELPPPEYGGSGGSLLVVLPAPETGEGAEEAEASPSPDIFILGVPVSYAAKEASGKFPFAVETALSFLKTARENPLDKRAAAAFLEGGEGDFRGLDDLAASLDYPENAVLVYLDLAAPPKEIVIHHGVRNGIAPLAMVRPLPGVLEKRGIPYTFGVRSHELYNLGLAEGPAVLEYAHRLETPALLLTAAGTAPGAGGVLPETLAEALVEYAAAVRWKTGGMDTHYSLFAYGDHIFFLSERLTIILILILLLAGTGIALRIRHFLPLRRTGELPGENTAASRQSGPEKPPHPGPWSDPCGHIAVFLAILGILGGTFLNLSCAPAFIWVLAFTILGAALDFAPAVFICALLSPFKGAETIFQTLKGGAFTGLPESVSPGIYLLPVLLVLPFLLLVIRGIILIVEKKHSRVSPEELEKSGL